VADLAGIVAQARNALEKQRPLDRVEGLVPDRPGLYAIHGDGNTWTGLGLGKPPDDRPLYVGKAEDSLVARDVKTHFGDGRTGQSTVRRSFAALLHDELLAVWSKPDGCTYALAAIEAVLLAKWQPPLNLQGIVTPWTPRLKSARAAMAEEARTWEPRSR
jgi:GIY-YIG catalytic domain